MAHAMVLRSSEQSAIASAPECSATRSMFRRGTTRSGPRWNPIDATLRKHAGIPAQSSAELRGILSRFEIGAPTDKHARATLAASDGGEEAREVLLRRAEALASRR